MKESEIEMEVIDKEIVDGEPQFGSDCWTESEIGSDADNMAESGDEMGDNSSEMADGDSEWQDRYLRLSAEFDNYRKRTSREKMELRIAGGEDVLKAILPVADDMDRALQAKGSAPDMEALGEGMALIVKKFFDALRSKGLAEIECADQEFDTDLHEAVAKFPVEESDKKGKVIDVAQKGYKYNDKVIRHAKVIVGE